MMTVAGGSAGERARSLRARASAARARAAAAAARADRLDSMAQNWEAGERGERRVAAALKPLEGPRCFVYHDRLLRPGDSEVNLDHVVVGESGIFLIDAKNWTGRIVATGDRLCHEADGRRRPRDRELQEVRAMADEMATRTDLAVEPVVCLAGEQSVEFGPAQCLQGVHVVPVDQLATWLAARPAPRPSRDVRREAASIAAAFPSATLAGPRATPPSHRAYAAPKPSGRPRPRSRPARPARPTDREARQLLKSLTLVAIVLVLTLTSFGRGLISGASARYTSWFAHNLNRESRSSTWTPPCRSMSDAQVRALVGRAVYRYADGEHDQCTWGLQPIALDSTEPVVTVQTGYLAQQRITGRTVGYTDAAGTVSVSLPQFVIPPGSSRPATATSQPVYVSLHYADLSMTAEQARRVVTAVLAATAANLPSGAGSTEVRQR